jgi:hypothetical protein
VGFPTFLVGNREISKVKFEDLEVNSQGLDHSDEKVANCQLINESFGTESKFSSKLTMNSYSVFVLYQTNIY